MNFGVIRCPNAFCDIFFRSVVCGIVFGLFMHSFFLRFQFHNLQFYYQLSICISIFSISILLSRDAKFGSKKEKKRYYHHTKRKHRFDKGRHNFKF